MNRREVITLVGGAAAVWPLAARAQQGERVRRIGAFISLAAGDAEGRARLTAFVQGLQDLGWNDGRNVRVDTRWSVGDAEGNRSYAAELVALTPDVILASGGTVMAPLHHATRTVPIVFTQVGDPVGAGFVESLARPGGNATGFTNFEYGIGAKWLELLKQIAPGLTRAAVLRDPTLIAGIGQLGAIQSVAPSFGVELRPLNVRVALAARHSFPGMYFGREFAVAGGLMTYSASLTEAYRLAGGYVSRIVNGANPADLPVLQPTKYELVINLKTAKALGLDVPLQLQQLHADKNALPSR